MQINYRLGPCGEKQLPEILEIFNEAIINTTALYDYKPRTLDMIKQWYTQKVRGNYPVLGAFDEKDSLLGFATYGPFRDRPAYKYTVEHSVYVRSDCRRKGLGTILLREVIKNAEDQDYHMMIGGIDASNSESIRLHEKEGFVFCGLIRQAGYKFGRWLDLAFYQLILKTPEHPVEDK
jgi:L-amino acid N-acyltransferase